MFRIIYRCSNCGHEWKMEYDSGTRVAETKIGFKGVRVGDDVSITGKLNESKQIECPACELTQFVTVKERLGVNK